MDMDSSKHTLGGRISQMDKVVEENRHLRGKIEGYKSLENLTRKKVEEVNFLRDELARCKQLIPSNTSLLISPLKPETGPPDELVPNGSLEIQCSSVPSQQLHTRSEQSSAFSLQLEYPFEIRPRTEIPDAKKLQIGRNSENNGTVCLTPNDTPNQTALASEINEHFYSHDRNMINGKVLCSDEQGFSSAIDSLGPQIISMANKVRYLEKKLKSTVAEKECLSRQLEESQGKDRLNSRGQLNKNCPYCNSPRVKNRENSDQIFEASVDIDVPGHEAELITFDRPTELYRTQLQNTDPKDLNNGSKFAGNDLGNVNETVLNNTDKFTELKLKYREHENEFKKIITSQREQLEDEIASKDRILRQLEVEKLKRQQLKEFVKQLESRLSVHHSKNPRMPSIQYDRKSFRDPCYQNELNREDKVVPDLLTEISVLHQQMVVVVEDFEKERSDRARAMSARDTLKIKFDSLADKVKLLKRQLVAAHTNLTEQISRNTSLSAEMSRLQSVLREKNQRKIHSAPIASRRTDHVARPDIAADFLNFWQNPNTNVEIATTTPADWSCDACTFSNPAQRTICEICGMANRSSVRSNNPYNIYGYHDHLQPKERICRLVSRGLSTDETVTGRLDDEIDVGDEDVNRSYSL